MSFADAMAVNSKFTRGVVTRTWPALAKGREFEVVYPCVSTKAKGEGGEKGKEEIEDGPMWKGMRVILSINRFERKKDIGLAIRAYAGLPKSKRKEVRLVIAGMIPAFRLPIIVGCY